jgi:hypothetical protein
VSNARLDERKKKKNAAGQHLVVILFLSRNLPAEPLFRVRFIYLVTIRRLSPFFFSSRFFIFLLLLSRQATVTIVASNDSGDEAERNE